MKFFSLVFSFYLLTLSVLPCNDGLECDDLSKTTISQTERHENHSHETEQCTPFCVCVCCGVHAFQLQTPFFPSKENVVIFDDEKQKAVYSFFYTKNVSSKIWQPPKVS